VTFDGQSLGPLGPENRAVNLVLPKTFIYKPAEPVQPASPE
ncbi:MAG: hypothetical protein AB1896_06800, partial [Thermodesulfobacteriota bacterium]